MNRNITGLLKSPIGLVAGAILLILILVFSLVFVVFLISGSSSNQGGFAACQQGDMNMEVWNAQFESAGAFTGKGDVFLEAAQRHSIDPVVLAAIAFHETGRGSSKMVRERNNPGGLYNSAAGTFFVYKTLDDGIDAMAANLYKNYIGQGLFTIEEIGSKYAPIGAGNDPTNLNSHWVPNVSAMVGTFGGLTAHCEQAGFASGFISPLKKLIITSRFGIRVHPISGEVHSHNGIDFACNTGDPIMAVTDGIVIESRFSSSWGNFVKINHGDKATLYAHMNQRYLKVGDTVPQGTPVGTCGSTGDSSGSHLHFEVYIGNTRIDPLPYFQGQEDTK